MVTSTPESVAGGVYEIDPARVEHEMSGSGGAAGGSLAHPANTRPRTATANATRNARATNIQAPSRIDLFAPQALQVCGNPSPWSC